MVCFLNRIVYYPLLYYKVHMWEPGYSGAWETPAGGTDVEIQNRGPSCSEGRKPPAEVNNIFLLAGYWRSQLQEVNKMKSPGSWRVALEDIGVPGKGEPGYENSTFHNCYVTTSCQNQCHQCFHQCLWLFMMLFTQYGSKEWSGWI